MTFGTRTLAQVFPESAHAQLLRVRMWPKSAGYRGFTELDETIARLAVRAGLAPLVGFEGRPATATFAPCLDLFWPKGRRRGHVGWHPEIMWSYVHHDAVRDIAQQCVRYDSELPVGTIHVIAFWCNDGEERSVCTAELLSGYLTRRNRAHRVFHTCRQLWVRRSCGGCRECDPHILSDQREAARRS